MYDARVDGGFPASSEFVAPPACKGGEECQPPPSEPPAKPSLASTAFSGAGNLAPPPPPPPTTKTVTKKTVVKCKKRKKLSHGKCVKPKKKINTKKSAARQPEGKVKMSINRMSLASLLALLTVLALGASSATAVAATPNWRVFAVALPSQLPPGPGGNGELELTVQNIGDAASKPGEPLTVRRSFTGGCDREARGHPGPPRRRQRT